MHQNHFFKAIIGWTLTSLLLVTTSAVTAQVDKNRLTDQQRQFLNGYDAIKARMFAH